MKSYYKISEEYEALFNKVLARTTLNYGVAILLVGMKDDGKNATPVKVSKISGAYETLLEKNLMVYIDEDLLSKLDNDSINILLEQELAKVSVNVESGAIKIAKPNINTFSTMINKYGADKVLKANELARAAANADDMLTDTTTTSEAVGNWDEK